MRATGSSNGELDGAITAVVDRHGLTEQAADALQRLVGLVDWEKPNFVPKSGATRGRQERPKKAAARERVASNILSESLSALELAPMRTARRAADIGSGAGFPGLVLAVALPEAQMTLVEKRPEKCAFLRRAKSELGLDNVDVREGTVQQWSDGVGACDVVTSRKVGRLNTIVAWCAPLLSSGGATILWQGDRDPAMEALAADAADAADLRLSQVLPIELEGRRGQPVTKHLYMYERPS
jgi:16S rRNA (guanine(527)-N(7))-methyltransferase RsmG